jgi:hypothetical protein
MWITPSFYITADELSDMMDRVDRTLHQWEQEVSQFAD